MDLTFCIDINAIKAYDPDNYYPDNCGAGMIIVNKFKFNYHGTDTSLLCLACKPGYKATMFSSVSYAVENC